MSDPRDRLTRLLNSALAVDSMGPGFKWARELDSKHPPRRIVAAFVATGGKTVPEIVADMARAMRCAGLLKP